MREWLYAACCSVKPRKEASSNKLHCTRSTQYLNGVRNFKELNRPFKDQESLTNQPNQLDWNLNVLFESQWTENVDRSKEPTNDWTGLQFDPGNITWTRENSTYENDTTTNNCRNGKSTVQKRIKSPGWQWGKNVKRNWCTWSKWTAVHVFPSAIN
jgi:hypothetical protein